MKQYPFRSLLLLYILCCSWLQGQGQANQQLRVLNSHFTGVWVGTHYDFSKLKTTPVRLEITENPKNGVLRLEYVYGTKGQNSYSHIVRFMAIEPDKSAVTLRWEHESKDRYHADGLDKVLSAGYGDITLSPAQSVNGENLFYRATFHLSPERLTYFWEKSADNVTFVKTAEWTLTREVTPNASTGL